MMMCRHSLRAWFRQALAIAPRGVLLAAIVISALGVAHAQSGTFVVPTIRASGGTDFAYWDLFARPPGSQTNVNYNYANPPALLNGQGRDADNNPTTAFASRTSLKQTGTSTCFVTSSGAIYSFAEITAFEVPYVAPATSTGEITNVIFQTQSGGSRLNVNSLQLQYKVGAQTFSVAPVYRALDDPQTGSFGERIVCGFQWNLTGLGVREFTIVFASPAASMPLWEAQLDVVVGTPFVQELGYLLATRSRPITRFGRVGSVDKNLPLDADGRYFFPGEQLNLLGLPEQDWESTGWFYDGQIFTGGELPLTFPAHDITVTGLFAPLTYQAWREVMFNHANGITGTENDYDDDTVSGQTVDHDGDGRTNLAEYAFGGDPYEPDFDRTQPQRVTVQVSGVDYPAVRYRTNGAPVGIGDAAYKVRLSTDLVTWVDNGTAPTTTTFSRELQNDGSELVTERALQPSSSFTTVAFQIAWTADGMEGESLTPGLPVITSPSTLAAGITGQNYSVTLTASNGTSPYSWSLTGGALHQGLSLAANGVLSGTPTESGTRGFTVQVVDDNGTPASKALQLTIALAPGITTTSLPTGLTNAPYTTTVAATGGTTPYTWSVASGSTLPAGFSLNAATGVLGGLSTTAGTSTFTLKITDSNGLSDTQELSLTIATSPVTITTWTDMGGGVKNLAYSQGLKAKGGTLPYAWTLESGVLPAGLNLNTAGVLAGTPVLAGNYSFTARLTDGGGIVALKTFRVSITESFQKPVVMPPEFETTTVGLEYTYPVIAFNYPKTFTIAGLPAGLKYAAATGVISGRPSVSGVFNIKIKAGNAAGTSAYVTVPLTVKALPNGLVGSFTGVVTRDATANEGLGGRLTLSVTSAGGFTAKVQYGKTTKQFLGGYLGAAAPQINVQVGTALLSLTLDKNTGIVTGTHGSAIVSGWRQTWDKVVNPATHRIGYYSVAIDLEDEDDIGSATIPQGYGYATFQVDAAGNLTVSGKTSDGQTITSAGFVGPTGQIAVYTSLYGNLGSVLGKLTLSEDEDGEFVDNEVSGVLTWKKPQTAATTPYPALFGPTDLKVSGKYLAADAKSEVLGLPETGLADLLFTDGGVSATATNPDVTGFTYTDENKVVLPAAGGVNNKAKATLAINAKTGAVSGLINLLETAPATVARNKVPFQGQIVRLADEGIKAVGYFILPQIPGSGQTLATSPKLSGSLIIEQPSSAAAN